MPEQNIDVVVRARDEASRTLDQVAGNVQRLTDRMTLAGGLIAGGVAAVGIFKLVKKFADQTSEAYLEQERVARGLSESQREFTSRMQDVLAVQDEHTNAAMRQAKALGVQEEQLETVTKAAIGLAEITGQSLSSAMFRVNEAINGNANALASYIPALRDANTEQEKLAIVSEFASRGLDMQLDRSRSIEGAINRRKAAYQDLMAAIGELVRPSERVQNTLAALASMAADVIKSMADSFSQGGGVIADLMEGLVVSIVGGLSIAETAVQNFGKVWELVTATFALAVEQWKEILRHTLTEVIPAYAIWFADNFVNIIRDAAVGAMTIIQNLGKNLGEAIFAIMEFIRSGFAGGMEGLGEKMGDALFVGLLDGFEAHTESLPEIVDRQITGREQFLADRVSRLGGDLGDSFRANFAKRMEQVRGLMAKFGEDFEFDTNLNLQGIADQARSSQQQRELGAVESRLLTRGPREDPQQRIIGLLTKIASNTKKVADNTDDPAAASEQRERLEVEMVP